MSAGTGIHAAVGKVLSMLREARASLMILGHGFITVMVYEYGCIGVALINMCTVIDAAPTRDYFFLGLGLPVLRQGLSFLARA